MGDTGIVYSRSLLYLRNLSTAVGIDPFQDDVCVRPAGPLYGFMAIRENLIG